MARKQTAPLKAQRQFNAAKRVRKRSRKAVPASNDIVLDNSVPAIMRHVHRGLSRGMEQVAAKHGVSLGTWYFLRVLWEEDGLSQTELSDRIGIVGPTTVIAIGRMVRDGLAVQLTDPTDRRKGRIYLTPKAKRLRKKMLDEAAGFVAASFEAIPAREIEQFRLTLRKIALNLEPHMPATIFSRLTAKLRR